MGNLFPAYMPLDLAAQMVGRSIKDDLGKTWYCAGHNDLGCLYFSKSQKPNAKRFVHHQLALKLYPSYQE